MVSKEDVKNLAELARLELSDSEVAELQRDLSTILTYVEHISAAAADTSAFVPKHRNVMRDDIPRTADHPLHNKEEALRVAFPKREGDYNVVRKIIQKDE